MGHKRRMMPDYYPSPLLVTIHRPRLSGTRTSESKGKTRRGTGVTSNNHAVTRYYPSPIAQVRKKEDEQQHRFLSLLRSSQHCLLPGRMFCFTFVKQLQAAARNARLVSFSWLGLRHLGSSGHPSCARRRTRSRLVYALRGLDVIYQVTVCALRGSDVIYQRPRKSTPDEV